MIKTILIAGMASLGAGVVAWGLFLESLGEKEWYRDIGDFRTSKLKAHCGLKFVFWGVVAEVVLGLLLATWEGFEMQQTKIIQQGLVEAAEPRHLTTEQQKDLSHQMARFAPIGFEFQIDPQADPSEMKGFSVDIGRALVGAGWRYNGVSGSVLGVDDSSGLAISTSPEAPGRGLRDALKSMNIESHLENLTIRNSENDVNIRIEPKPMLRKMSK